MPRVQRKKGEFSNYHIIQRGNERKKIFIVDNDKTRFLETLARAREKYDFLVYSYCLMDNHVHLLVNDNGNDISRLMKSINVSYVAYFNRTYHRSGHLFQDRFRSELIEDDSYFLEVSRYIHNNPIKAGIVKNPNEYKWSSYSNYMGEINDTYGLLNTSKILTCFSENRKQAVTEYSQFSCNETNKNFLDIEEELQGWEQENHAYIEGIIEAKARIQTILKQENMAVEEMLKDKQLRNKLIKEIRKHSSISLKELGDLFGGISESQISRIISK